MSQLDALRFLVRGDVHTLRAAAVRFVLANHLVSSAVLGPRSVEQLEQLVRETGAGPRYLPDEDLGIAAARALAGGHPHVTVDRSEDARARARRRARGGPRDRAHLRRRVRRRVQGEERSGHARRSRSQRLHLRRARARVPGDADRRRGERSRVVRRVQRSRHTRGSSTRSTARASSSRATGSSR